MLKKFFSSAHASPIPINFSLLGKGGEKNDCLFPLTNRAIGIGTDPQTCSIVYSARTQGISAFHCQLAPQENGWTLTDFSDTGTWLNGTKMTKFQPYQLKVGDVFYIASLENSFCLYSETAGITNDSNLNSNSNFNSTTTAPPMTTPVQNFNTGNVPPQKNFFDSIKEKFFNWKGRLNRQPYALRVVPLNIISNALVRLLAESDNISEGITLIMAVTIIVMTVATFMLAIRRLHDIDLSGYWVIVAIAAQFLSGFTDSELMTIVAAAFGLYLLLKKGTVGVNRFGADPLNQS